MLVPPDAGLRRGERPGWTGGMYSFMRRVLATAAGHDLYRHRQITVEPVFGQIKCNREIKRFQRRGRTPVAASGGSSPRPTTCSSSTTTASPPRHPDRGGRPAAARAAAHSPRRRSIATTRRIYPTASGISSSRPAASVRQRCAPVGPVLDRADPGAADVLVECRARIIGRSGTGVCLDRCLELIEPDRARNPHPHDLPRSTGFVRHPAESCALRMLAVQVGGATLRISSGHVGDG